MYENRNICVVVPAFNEEKLIGSVLDSMPQCVDQVVVVNDASTDGTAAFLDQYDAGGCYAFHVIHHTKNGGVGRAIRDGYAKALDIGADIVVVMAGDGQMGPDDLESLVAPVARGEVDYAKGNRLFTGAAWKIIPRIRYIGNAALSLLTKIASGYWHIADSQTGYTAISARILRLIDVEKIYSRYGMPNDLLTRLNVVNARVRDIPVRPIYNIGEKSGIVIPLSVITIGWLLVRLFFWRMFNKYVIRDFHPLIFFYFLGGVASVFGLIVGLLQVYMKLTTGTVMPASTILVALLVISGTQFTLFAMWFDMESNRHLR